MLLVYRKGTGVIGGEPPGMHQLPETAFSYYTSEFVPSACIVGHLEMLWDGRLRALWDILGRRLLGPKSSVQRRSS
jgi:hypothetical protein